MILQKVKHIEKNIFSVTKSFGDEVENDITTLEDIMFQFSLDMDEVLDLLNNKNVCHLKFL